MPQYSPSSRTDFSFCPRYWWLRRRYRTRRVGYPELCAMGGRAVSEAMASWNRARIAGQPTTLAITLDTLLEVGVYSLKMQHHENQQEDRHITGLKDHAFSEQVPQLVERGIRALWASDPLQGLQLIAAEQEYPDHGDARPDVISWNQLGEKVVDDYKCKFSPFDVNWMDGEFEKHFDGEQRLTYTPLAGCDLFGIILVLLQPHTNRKPHPPMVIRRISRVQAHERRLWLNDVRLGDDAMKMVDAQEDPWCVPGKAAPHRNQHGECPFKTACVDDGLDESRMKLNYVRIAKEGRS